MCFDVHCCDFLHGVQVERGTSGVYCPDESVNNFTSSCTGRRFVVPVKIFTLDQPWSRTVDVIDSPGVIF